MDEFLRSIIAYAVRHLKKMKKEDRPMHDASILACLYMNELTQIKAEALLVVLSTCKEK